ICLARGDARSTPGNRLRGKCSINQLQCYGCGVCRALCPKDAITLPDRNAIPALANEW
ncbi:MAG: hypothetical protein GTO49_12175, partial [Anaerolineae bacterium]|nr:hypothetical protein [Anaerolineae bacterium]